MFIDGVFSGGGIKGFALIGAFEAIENRGLQFKRVAGTSAGSLVAALIAAGYTSKEIYELIDEVDMEEFLDRRKTFIPLSVGKWLFLYWRLGLYKGVALEGWLEDKLEKKGLKTFGDLPAQGLRIIASDLTNGRLIVLPDDLPHYNIDPYTFSIAKAVRMSCSLPYFFEPVKLYNGKECSLIVDGGVLSNFPMWLFDKDNTKKVRPVIGIKLSHNLIGHPKHIINNAIDMFEGLFETMKDAHDSRYISRKHEKNIIFIPTEGFLTTEFKLTDEKKKLLVKLGRECAEDFLTKWTY
ncbi:patatin-like phospholipase family protein [Cytobacillus sp. FJAT-54145]|uniref:Patatin-like phospholipase family protein n=1 Tax=Cytobacillus spartinae TaxID=3299023 RepID=A0ABW6KEA6_9BACI